MRYFSPKNTRAILSSTPSGPTLFIPSNVALSSFDLWVPASRPLPCSHLAWLKRKHAPSLPAPCSAVFGKPLVLVQGSRRIREGFVEEPFNPALGVLRIEIIEIVPHGLTIASVT
jgi:hypothetical protein